VTNKTIEVGIFPERRLSKILKQTGLTNQVTNKQFFCRICKYKVPIEDFGAIANLDDAFVLVCNNIECISDIQRRLLQ